MTISETMKQCYEARELPAWGDILNAADELDRLSRQLAEARSTQEMCDKALDHAGKQLVDFSCRNIDLSRQLAEAREVIERQAKVLRIIEEMLLPAEQTGWLSGSGREIMRMVRAALSPPAEEKP